MSVREGSVVSYGRGLLILASGTGQFMKALTFGWDFPPQTTGGLGMACQGLTRELEAQGVSVTFVLPRTQPVDGHLRFVFADVESELGYPLEGGYSAGPYQSAHAPLYTRSASGQRVVAPNQLLDAVHIFAKQAATIAAAEEFDIIHAHDWTSYLAGMAAKRVSGKPLVVHVHATAFDQAASAYVDPDIYDIERAAFAAADCVVTVSDFTRRMVIEKYQAAPEKVEVVHNGADQEAVTRYEPTLAELRAQGKKFVLYHGRITVQKGVDYFVAAARKVIETDPDVIFIISGKGDMEAQIMHQVGASGLSSHVRFAGALWYAERDQMYQSVDLVVMPSVSEPFGLVPLEAIRHGTPALISKQSGVSEVVSHVLKVDFWDVDEMANKILAALRYPVMRTQLVREGQREADRITWRVAAEKVSELYQRLLRWFKTQLA